MSNNTDFDKCLKEAYKLNTKHFHPELDSLENETIADVLYSILLVWDLLEQGEPEEDNIPIRSINPWKKKVRAFMLKWMDKIEIESEKIMYVKFN